MDALLMLISTTLEITGITSYVDMFVLAVDSGIVQCAGIHMDYHKIKFMKHRLLFYTRV